MHVKIMANGVIMVPPHGFENPSRLLQELMDILKYNFGVVYNGITSILNFTKIRPVILWLLNAYSCEKVRSS
jgi:hypothetical protein